MTKNNSISGFSVKVLLTGLLTVVILLWLESVFAENASTQRILIRF